MKNLSDLKKKCHLYKWKMIHNSWFKTIAPHMSEYRAVASVQSNGLYFNTCKDGTWSKSFLDFPKASELHLCVHDDGSINLTITRSDHQMIYKLEPHIF